MSGSCVEGVELVGMRRRAYQARLTTRVLNEECHRFANDLTIVVERAGGIASRCCKATWTRMFLMSHLMGCGKKVVVAEQDERK